MLIKDTRTWCRCIVDVDVRKYALMYNSLPNKYFLSQKIENNVSSNNVIDILK